MPLIKSHSNYVLKSRHQEVNDGTIWERDITTIGGISSFPSGQVPVYNSGNFIITVRNDRGVQNKYNKSKWESHESGDTWTINDVNALVSSDETQDDTKIVLKQDYYDLRDFAYYGSLSELFRSSVGDILARFPGELYMTDHTVTYVDYSGDSPQEKDLIGSTYHELSNPYGIDIHSKSLPDNADPLRFFAEEGWKNYDYIPSNSTSGTPITSWATSLYVKKAINPTELDTTYGLNARNDLFYLMYLRGQLKETYDRSAAHEHLLSENEYLYSYGSGSVEWKFQNSGGTYAVQAKDYIGKQWVVDRDSVSRTSSNNYGMAKSGSTYISGTPAYCASYIKAKHDAVNQAWTDYAQCAAKNYSTVYENRYNQALEQYDEDVASAKTEQQNAYTTAKSNSGRSTSSETITHTTNLENITETYNTAIGNANNAHMTCLTSATKTRAESISAATRTKSEKDSKALDDLNTAKTKAQTDYNNSVSSANTQYSAATASCQSSYDTNIGYLEQECESRRVACSGDPSCLEEVEEYYNNQKSYFERIKDGCLYQASVNRSNLISQARSAYNLAISNAEDDYDMAIANNETEYNSAVHSAETAYTASVASCERTYETAKANALTASGTSYSQEITRHENRLTEITNTYNADITAADNRYSEKLTAALNTKNEKIKSAKIAYINSVSTQAYACESYAKSTLSSAGLTNASKYYSDPSIYATGNTVYEANFAYLSNYSRHAEMMRNAGNAAVDEQYVIYDALTCLDPNCFYSDFCSPDHIGKVTINGSINIEVAIGDEQRIYYLSTSAAGFRFRPNESYLTDFYNGCSNFQRLLVDPTTSPKYKATFSIIKENDFGYYRDLEDFIFPTAEGGYNLNADSYGFTQYTKHMVEVGEYYDELFTDNLYRNMTHESIKNFDWTRPRISDDGIGEEIELGADKMRKMLRIVAREFDEVKSYIDGIKNVNSVTYDERNNIPDYFLSDVLSDDGWDVKLVYPYLLDERYLEGDKYKMVPSGYTETEQLKNVYGSDNLHFERLFSQNTKNTIKPYSSGNTTDEQVKSGYFMTCCSGTSTKKTADGPVDVCANGRISFRIKQYSSEKEYTVFDAGNQFLRNMKINSLPILRRKGTLEGIEMVLGMFGLKSNRYDEKNYDYKVTEYSSFTKRIEDKWLEAKQMYEIDWYNSTKTIQYDYRSEFSSFIVKPNTYLSYQGLPIAFRDKVDAQNKVHRYLYPHFSKEEKIDGDPYFQMDGGWLAKSILGTNGSYNFQFDVDDNIVYNKAYNSAITSTESSDYFVDNAPIYKETVRAIRSVDTVQDLVSLPSDSLYNGQICYVNNVEDNVMSIDGLVYEIHEEYSGSTNGLSKYIILEVLNGYIGAGDKYFSEKVTVYDKYGTETDYYIGDKENGFEIKAYIKETGGTYSFVCHDDAYGVENYYVLTTKDGDTNYFKIGDTMFNQNLSDFAGFGWKRLTEDDEEYKRINVITNYYKGNNPHNGNLSYDSGHEYFTYFKRLFKYAEDNDKFDERCFDDYFTAIGTIPTFGFSGLIEDNEAIDQYTPYLIEDGKIHYFGHYKTVKDNSSSSSSARTDNIDKVRIYTDNDNTDKINGYKKIYSSTTTTVENYILNSKDNMVDKYSGYTDASLNAHFKWPSSAVTDEVTDQVMNNKRLTIEFNLHNEWYSQQGQCEMKYLDDIVMNYLTQMIPSTTIVDVVYFDKKTACTNC